MDAHTRQLRWLFILRLVTLVAAFALLPQWVALGPGETPALALWLAVLVGLAALPVGLRAFRGPRWMAALGFAEVLVIGLLVYRYGELQSPFALLYLPLVAQTALFSSVPGYILVAGYAFFGYGMAVWAALGFPALGDVTPLYVPVWAPLYLMGGLALITAVGLLGQAVLSERRLRARSGRRLERLRALVERLPAQGDEGPFWRRFLAEVARQERFAEAALIRFHGPRPVVVATARPAAWESLARRQAALLQRVVLATGRTEILVEEANGRPARAIACYPLPRPGAEGGHGAVLCVLAPRVPTVERVNRSLARWAGLASLALAAGEPRLTLHRTRVDWRVLMDVTLHRLHARLKPYLVLVDVAEGAVEGDALLLADAIAHAIEGAIERAPRGTPVRLSVKRERAGWVFTVETALPPATAKPPARAGMLLAEQVVSAHGGAWRSDARQDAFVVGFTLPADQA